MRAAVVLLGVLAVGLLRPDAAPGELRVFVTNEKSNDVTVIDATAGTVLKTIPMGQRPRGVAGSRDGRRVYVANSNSDSVSIIDAVSLAVLDTVPAGRDPEGVALNEDGTVLYVVNDALRWSASSSCARRFLQTLRDPGYLAEAKKVALESDAVPGDEVERIVHGLFRLDSAKAAKLRYQ